MRVRESCDELKRTELYDIKGDVRERLKEITREKVG